MAFLSPAVLWALGALAVPILLHLFYFRRYRRVDFSDVRFLREVNEETQNRARLRNLVVLLLRLTAFAAIVLAFAQPMLRSADARRDAIDLVAVFIDNSFSMSAQSAEVSLLERARQRAREVIEAHGETVEYQLLTNELSGASSRTLSRDDALAAIDEIVAAPESREVAAVAARIRPEADVAYLISDLQASQFDLASLERVAADTTRRMRAVVVPPVAARNVAIDTVAPLTPVQLIGEPTELLVTLTNYGAEDAEAVRLSARAQGRIQPFGTREVPAGTTLVDTVTLAALNPGPVDLLVSITDFPVEFDDEYRLSFEVRDALRGLSIGESSPNPFLAAAFPEGGSLVFDHVAARAVSYGELREYDLVVLDDLDRLSSGLARALGDYALDGGKVLVFPSARAEVDGYRALTSLAGVPTLGAFVEGDFLGGRLNDAAFEFREVFERLPRNVRLPTARGRFTLDGRGGEALLSFRDGEPLVVGGDLGAGRLYLSAVPLDDGVSDLTRSGEVFVPMLYRMALAGRSARPASHVVGDARAVSFPLPETIGEGALRLLGSGGEFVPAQRRIGDELVLSFGESPRDAGFYTLLDEADSAIAHLAFNYDRTESPQRFTDPDALAGAGIAVFDGDRQGVVAAAVERAGAGRAWWPLLIAVALAALLAEALVLRLWRPTRGAADRQSPSTRRHVAAATVP